MKSGSGAFDTDEFVARLLTFMGGRKHASPAPADDDDDDSDYEDDGGILDWERIGRRALAKSRRVPAMDFMCVSYLVNKVSPFASEHLHPPYIASCLKSVVLTWRFCGM